MTDGPDASAYLTSGWHLPSTRGDRASHLDDLAVAEHFGTAAGEHVRAAGQAEDDADYTGARQHLDSASDMVAARLRSGDTGLGDYGTQAAKLLLGTLRQHGSRLAARARMPVPPAQQQQGGATWR